MTTNSVDMTQDERCPEITAAIDLHDTAWAARGYEVVRRGTRSPARGTGPFLLLEPVDLVDFDVTGLDVTTTTRVDITETATVYDERVVVDADDRLLGITRDYVTPAGRPHDVFLTMNQRIARVWANSSGSRAGRWAIRALAGHPGFPRLACAGRVRDASVPGEAMCFVRRLGDAPTPWPRPDFPNGPVGKRLFDVVTAAAILIIVAPLLPLLMMAIWIEDGGPVLFAHTRQTRGGRRFVCYKLRTMCREADKLKLRIAHANVCDGPQFFVRNDPRLLRTGRWLRRFHLDELPQLYNVLRGDMSLVGPRPSPDRENRFCPAWREARLSVRPGITGLWQVRRTRAPQMDFHEWIRFDLEYVRNPSWRMEFRILVETVRCLLGRRRSRDDLTETVLLHFPTEAGTEPGLAPQRRAA